jgi:hypothetical protein
MSHPVVPVGNGLGGGFIGVDGLELCEGHAQSATAPLANHDLVSTVFAGCQRGYLDFLALLVQ